MRPTQRRAVPRFGWGFVTIGLVVLLAGCAAPVSFPSADPLRLVTLTGSLHRPEGSGPFPAMVLPHTCGGLAPHILNWAAWLKAEGYVALVVDSFSPRGITNSCGRPHLRLLLDDGVGALAHLRSLQYVNKDRIGVVGWSSGGMAAIHAASEAEPSPADGFHAAIAFYPGHRRCWMYRNRVPILLLLGEVDPANGVCVDQAKQFQQEGRTVLLTVYSGAYHGFDQAELGNRIVDTGFDVLRYDPVATADAEKRIREFLARHLRR